jgi:hypothetical protein
MSRSGSDYDGEEDFPNQGAFWWHNAQRALKGKRGRKALAELREALLMLPEKRLVSGAISTAALAAKAEAMPDTRPSWANEGHIVPNYQKTEALAKCESEGVGVCAIGAYLLRKRVLELGETPAEAMQRLPSLADVEDCGLWETAAVGEQAGLTNSLAFLLADRNDETYGSCTPEQRYEQFLAWIDKELTA